MRIIFNWPGCQATRLSVAITYLPDLLSPSTQRGVAGEAVYQGRSKRSIMSNIITISAFFFSLIILALFIKSLTPPKPAKPRPDSQGRRRAIINGEYIDFDEQERINSSMAEI